MEYRALCDVIINTDLGPDYVQAGEVRELDKAPSAHWERVGGEPAKEPAGFVKTPRVSVKAEK